MVDINHNGVDVKSHYRENSFGGSSGYGSVSSQNGGARPKLLTDIPKVSVRTFLAGSKYLLPSVKAGSKTNILGSKIWWPYNGPVAVCTGSYQI